VQDPAVIVSFPVLPDKEYSFLAWTTTPWYTHIFVCVGVSVCDPNTSAVATRILE
jgi:isoleucyl-tRNA synthetase